jgi:hypothetical protein
LAFHSGREADHSPPSGTEVKEWVELYLHSPNAPSWRGAQFGEHRDNFTFTLLNAFVESCRTKLLLFSIKYQIFLKLKSIFSGTAIALK